MSLDQYADGMKTAREIVEEFLAENVRQPYDKNAAVLRKLEKRRRSAVVRYTLAGAAGGEMWAELAERSKGAADVYARAAEKLEGACNAIV